MKYRINENLELVPVSKNYNAISLIIAMALTPLVYIFFFHTQDVLIKYKTIHRSEQTTTKDIELSEQSIVNCLHENGCVLPNVALAQAKLESNLGKSKVGKNAKNMFGIVHHKCCYVKGKYGVYAKYDSYADNIKCYIHIQDFYLKNIDGVYAEDNNYIKTLKTLK